MLPDRDDAYGHPRRRARSYVPLALLLGILIGVLLGGFASTAVWLVTESDRPPPGIGPTFKPFWQAWHLVDEHYVDRAAVKPKNMTEGAISGMLASLGDIGHTGYVNKRDFERLQQDLKGQLEGIGAYMSIRNTRPTITGTVPGSPARAAGLKPGDVLVEVEGAPVAHLSLQDIVDKVRGPAGSKVHLKVMRARAGKPLTFEIARANVEVPDVSWRVLPGTDIAHIGIVNFGNQVDEQLRKAFQEARSRGARKLLVDLRGNRGGLKEQAVAVTSEFLSSGTVFIEQDAKGNQTEIPVKEGGQATDIPLCVLIDEGTASSAEIFAGAIQDYQRGKLVGATTFGTGTVLQPFSLSDGGAVLLAIAEWLTPKGRRIWHNGIAPDVPVAMPENAVVVVPNDEIHVDAASLASSSDKQLLEAIKLLNKEPSAKEVGRVTQPVSR